MNCVWMNAVLWTPFKGSFWVKWAWEKNILITAATLEYILLPSFHFRFISIFRTKKWKLFNHINRQFLRLGILYYFVGVLSCHNYGNERCIILVFNDRQPVVFVPNGWFLPSLIKASPCNWCHKCCKHSVFMWVISGGRFIQPLQDSWWLILQRSQHSWEPFLVCTNEDHTILKRDDHGYNFCEPFVCFPCVALHNTAYHSTFCFSF